MSTVITSNIWRHHQPSAFKLKYNVKTNTYVFVNLNQELMQGSGPVDIAVLLERKKQMGYICDYYIDVEPENGKVIPLDDGRGFFYQPDKDFSGSDFVSYRVINVMGQTSEPQCIYFNVGPTMVNGRVEDIIIKLDTIILHNGNSSVFNESKLTTSETKDRNVYAFNLLPEKWYALYIVGTYGDSCGKHYGSGGYMFHPWTETVNHLLGMYQAGEGGEFEVLTFTTPIDLATIGVADVLTDPDAYAGRHAYCPFIKLDFMLNPIGDARVYAKDSNRIKYNYYDPTVYTTPEPDLPFPEDDPTVDPNVAKLIVKSNVDIKIINENNKRKLLMLVNSRELVALNKPIKTGRVQDVSGKTESTGTLVTSIDVTNTKYASSNFLNYNTLETYDLDAAYNLPGDVTATDDTNFVQLNVNLSSIASFNGNIALVAHVSDPIAIYKHTDFEIKYLNKDAITGEYSIGTEYSGFIVLEVFNCNYPVIADNPSLEIQFVANFTSNAERLLASDSVYDVDTGKLLYYPIDVSKILGFVTIPCNVIGSDSNTNALMSNYVPVAANSIEGFSYKAISPSIYKAIYLGDSANLIVPSLFTTTEMQLYSRPTCLVPDLILTLLRSNKFAYKLKWNLVDITDPAAPTDLPDLQTYIVENPDKVLDFSKVVNVADNTLCLEYSYGDTEHTSNDIPEAYPEIVSIHIRKEIDNWFKGTATSPVAARFAIIVDYDKNNATENAFDVTLKIANCNTNNTIISKGVSFDGSNPVQHLYFGTLEWDVARNITFNLKLASYD